MRQVRLTVLALLVSVAPATAGPLGIEVLNDSYVTNVGLKVTRLVGIGTETVTPSNALSSGNPIADELQGSAKVFARATADTFSVSSRTSALPDFALDEISVFAKAYADTNLWFRPVEDGIASLALSFTTSAFESHFTQGLISLFDATANQTLWTFTSNGGIGNVPWTPTFDCCAATVNINQTFFSTHLYILTMHAGSDANTDSMRLSASVSGLHQVPEPTTLSLLTIGVTALLYRRRKRARQ